MFDVSFHILKTYRHALFNVPQKEAYEYLFRWLLDVVKPLRTLRKFGKTLLFCHIWAIPSRPMSSQFRGHFGSTNIFGMMLSSMI